MNRKLTGTALFVLMILSLYTALNMTPFASAPVGMGKEITAIFLKETKALNSVSAIIFDFRGYDTFGEAIVLFTAVAGTITVLRKVSINNLINRSDKLSMIVRTIIAMIIPFSATLAFYIILHGHLSPGGGFQGGVILASLLVLIFLAEGRNTVQKNFHNTFMSKLESSGALMFLILAVSSLFRNGLFFENIFNKGSVGELYSSGTIFWMNMAVGLKVFAGISIIILLFISFKHTPEIEEEEEC